jgi:hypothetical protein
VPETPDMLFDLHILPDGEGYRVKATAAYGEPAEALVAPPGEKFRRDLPFVQDILLQGSNANVNAARRGYVGRLDAQADRMSVQQMGSEIFRLLFAGKIGRLYEENTEIAKKKNVQLRIQLSVDDAPGLLDVPWEMLYDQSNRQHLCLYRPTSFFRTLDATPFPKSSEPPVRILCMSATPDSVGDFDFDPIDAAEEESGIRGSLDKRIEFHRTMSGTRQALKERLRQRLQNGGWDVFHFIGHGGYDADSAEGFLYVQEPGGAGVRALYGTKLVQMLVGPQATPQLVVLNSCLGAKSAPGHQFSSISETLIAGGIPAVIAMQFEITEVAAQVFSRGLYKALSEGATIQNAVISARQDLSDNGSEWVTPVLYMSCPDFSLVDPKRPPAEPRAGGES